MVGFSVGDREGLMVLVKKEISRSQSIILGLTKFG